MIDTILLATTNKGKAEEMTALLADLPFTVLSLHDLEHPPEAPVEDAPDIVGNAILKARYYANATGHLTIADDSGLFVHELNDWPGVVSARIGKNGDERRAAVLEKMKNLPEGKRDASFRIALACYDPIDHNTYVIEERENGSITTDVVVSSERMFDYDPIFFVPGKGKTYAELTIEEKNEISHRGKAVQMMKYYLTKQYSPRQLLVAAGVIFRDGKILMNKRNDPHNPQFHGLWEFPGGGIEYGESVIDSLKREVKEETGYDVEPIKLLQGVHSQAREGQTWMYQVNILVYLCRITAGEEGGNPAEVLETRWFDPDEILSMPLIGNNAQMYKEILPELKKLI